MVREIELAGMRSAQEGTTLGDECRVERRTVGAYNNNTFKNAESKLVIYEGPCELSLVDHIRDRPIFGEITRTDRLWRWSGPSAAQDIEEGDIIVMTAVRDPWALREVSIIQVQGGGFASRRQALCEEVE